jgi:acetylornithine/succinyldiaminopimelate/putrescine aminotransferase
MITNRELFLNFLGQTSDSPYLVEIERAEGIYLFGPNGEKYIDLISGVSVNSLGHNFKPVIDAVKKQLEMYTHLMVYGEFIQSPQVELSKYLVNLLPEKINSVYFVNSGSEAIEGAIKLAKRYTGRTKMIAFKNAYHGSSHGALSLCGNEEFKSSFRPLLPDVWHLELNNYSQLNDIDVKTACVVLETIQAEAGVIIPTFDYMQALALKCKATGALLILDEIQTGFGRTGRMFGFEHYNILPDIVCFAKAMGGGMPIGAFAAPKLVMDSFKSNPVLGHITTFGGHPVSAAASLAAISHINESGIVDDVKSKELLFRDLLIHPLISEIRGEGLLLAVEIGSFDNVIKFVRKGLEVGFVTDWFIFHDSAFRIAPPLNITYSEIKNVCGLIIDALNQI